MPCGLINELMNAFYFRLEVHIKQNKRLEDEYCMSSYFAESNYMGDVDV